MAADEKLIQELKEKYSTVMHNMFELLDYSLSGHTGGSMSMLDIIKSDIGRSPIKLAIVRGRDTSTVKSLKEVFEYNFVCREIHQAYFGPSITINAGPDAIGVMFSKQAK